MSKIFLKIQNSFKRKTIPLEIETSQTGYFWYEGEDARLLVFCELFQALVFGVAGKTKQNIKL